MKLLFENWRKYLKEIKDIEFLNERINSLDSNKRFVNNKLTEVDVEDPSSQFPLSEEELQKIRSCEFRRKARLFRIRLARLCLAFWK